MISCFGVDVSLRGSCPLFGEASSLRGDFDGLSTLIACFFRGNRGYAVPSCSESEIEFLAGYPQVS